MKNFYSASDICLTIIAVIFTYLIYAIVIKPLGYWKQRNVPHHKPWPILGSMAPFAFGKKSTQEMFQYLYDGFPEARYVGTHMFVRPALLIRDPELIKQLAIKDFDHFTDHALFQGIEDIDPETSKSLLMLRGQKWKDIRATISPCFTASKMKFMFTLLSECAADFTKFFQEQDSDVISLEMRDTFSRFVVDAIATSAFGVKVDSLKKKQNDFFVLGKHVCNLEGLRALRLIVYSTLPMIMRLLRAPAIPRKYTGYFFKVFEDVIHARETTGIVRPDMIHIFLERRKIELLNGTNSGKDLSNESLIAQAMTFFIAGFANTTNVMSFLGYELALNPDVQKKLQAEIDNTLVECNGEITYDAIVDMKYMNMVISEILRIWPAGSVFDRMCVKDYIITPKLPNEKPLLVEKGTTLLFSLAAIHHDPKYFNDPLKFDPERFSDKYKPNIKPFTSIPFGAGPRYCVAKRFVLMELKIFFFHLLSKFDIVTTEKTAIPLIQSKFKINMGAEGGIWLGLRQR